MAYLDGVKVGDKLWLLSRQYWGTVIEIHIGREYPVHIVYEDGRKMLLTMDGLFLPSESSPCVFWDKVEFTPPPRPRPRYPVPQPMQPVIVYTLDGVPRIRFATGTIRLHGVETYIENSYNFPNKEHTAIWEHWNPLEEGIDPDIKKRIYEAGAEYVHR
jgi:hypothetical protein